MRTHPILLLIVGLTLAACDDTGGPSGKGTLVVSTSTGGTEPDQDGYLLTVDGAESLVLVPTGSAEVDLPPGRHTLRLLGVAEHCSVAPATSVQVEVPSQGTIPVAFEISCRVTGTLVVSTSTGGNDPDPDGYLLTVDGLDSLVLVPTGTAEVDLPPGQHTLELLGLAEHCSVAPATPLEVDVPPHGTTPVAFEISCNLTGARITTTTTGLDFDPFDGYRVEVDGTDRGILPSSGTVLTLLDPGSRTLALTGLAPNCTIDGLDSHTVTIVDTEITPVEFVVVCTATSGVIKVIVTGANTGIMYQATVDGATPFQVGTGGPAYLGGISAGDHLVSLTAPANCSVQPNQQSVRVTAGSLVRDTVEASFSVTACTGSGTIRVGILSSFYSLIGFTPVQITLDGKVHDVQAPDGQAVTLTFGGLSLGMHSLQAQFTYDFHEWIRCHSTESLHAFTQPVSIIGPDTVRVELEIGSSVHCHFR